jgi:3-phenylpropionate/cinnamic acid dioxygenase small subunit
MSGPADDRDEIQALIHEYAFRLDAGDLDGVAALFEHAEVGSTRHDRRRRGAREARAVYDGIVIYEDGTPRTQHQITNVTIGVRDDHATARCCFTVLQVTGQGLHPVLAGEYHDRFERVDGTWRFAERIFDPRLFGDMSRHMKPPES